MEFWSEVCWYVSRGNVCKDWVSTWTFLFYTTWFAGTSFGNSAVCFLKDPYMPTFIDHTGATKAAYNRRQKQLTQKRKTTTSKLNHRQEKLLQTVHVEQKIQIGIKTQIAQVKCQLKYRGDHNCQKCCSMEAWWTSAERALINPLGTGLARTLARDSVIVWAQEHQCTDEAIALPTLSFHESLLIRLITCLFWQKFTIISSFSSLIMRMIFRLSRWWRKSGPGLAMPSVYEQSEI